VSNLQDLDTAILLSGLLSILMPIYLKEMNMFDLPGSIPGISLHLHLHNPGRLCFNKFVSQNQDRVFSLLAVLYVQLTGIFV